MRGTIGGRAGETLSPLDVVRFAAGYGAWLQQLRTGKQKVVIGRDARPSGAYYSPLITNTLNAMGIDVVDLGLSTTPTVEMAVVAEAAQGGIILTASHNPAGWNALKLLNADGQFLSAEDGKKVLEWSERGDIIFADARKFGNCVVNDSYIDWHIAQILNHPLVDVEAVKEKKFNVAFDAVNSTGGIAVPRLLDAMGITYKALFAEPDGKFPHDPEPVPQNLQQLQNEIEAGHYDLGIAVDPDVDRLAFISDNGRAFGEEYTLVAIADYVLSKTGGATVSNLSSSQALKEVTEKYGHTYYPSAVGEVNVVSQMKAVGAVIGGEGNGGIILPDLHYGRDALAGIALFLSYLAQSGKTASQLRSSYPSYYISKNKIELTHDLDLEAILLGIQNKYSNQPIVAIDGVKIHFDNEWVHLRKSNTEPIIRIFAESDSLSKADVLAHKIMSDIKEMLAV